METLTDLLLDPEVGFISVAKLKKKFPQYSIKEIQQAKDKLSTYQINTPIPKPNKFNTITADHAGDCIQIDLMDVSYNSTANKQIKFLLTFIDVYSRYVLYVPLKNKSAKTVSTAMETLIHQFPRKIYNVTSDDGPEFNNTIFKNVLTNNDIQQWITPANTPNKMAIIERFHRTLRNRMRLLIDHNNSESYIDHLPALIRNYNTTFHRTIKTTPHEVLYNDVTPGNSVITEVDYSLQLGDTVRRSLKKSTFGKGTNKLSEETYIISGINPSSFIISNQSGIELSRPYQGYELKKVTQPTKTATPTTSNKTEVANTARKRYKQKRDPAFNDTNTHEVDDEGIVHVTRRHLQPINQKRKITPNKKYLQ